MSDVRALLKSQLGKRGTTASKVAKKTAGSKTHSQPATTKTTAVAAAVAAEDTEADAFADEMALFEQALQDQSQPTPATATPATTATTASTTTVIAKPPQPVGGADADADAVDDQQQQTGDRQADDDTLASRGDQLESEQQMLADRVRRLQERRRTVLPVSVPATTEASGTAPVVIPRPRVPRPSKASARKPKHAFADEDDY
ncbi:hypothetical protein BC831DRAFT_218231 [Entophlyctis helioformis]|nr:hypothetical protein BC831DRAFT_218231 [Entophlyctis helioformis]